MQYNRVNFYIAPCEISKDPVALGFYLFAAFFCFAFPFLVPFQWDDSRGYKPLITWDLCGYYLYLPTIFYDKLGEHNKYDYIVNTYHPSGVGLDVWKSPKGKMVIKYTSGMAILYLPGFLVGHYWAQHAGYPVDGFSYPLKNLALAMYSLLISFMGLWFMRKVLLLHFTEGIVALALVLLCATTNYLNFSANRWHVYAQLPAYHLCAYYIHYRIMVFKA